MSSSSLSIPRLKDPKQFFVWWTVFQQFATIKGFRKALRPTPEADLVPEDQVIADPEGAGAAAVACRQRNEEACAYIILAMTEKLVVSVRKAGNRDTDYPSGKACLMVEYLLKKYQNDSAVVSLNAQDELRECVMKPNDEPDVLFDAVSQVQMRYHGLQHANMTDDVIVAQVIAALPDKYSSTVSKVAIEAKAAGRAIDIVDLQESVNTHYAVLTKGKRKEKSKDIIGGLAAVDDEVTPEDALKKMIADSVKEALKSQAPKVQPVPPKQELLTPEMMMAIVKQSLPQVQVPAAPSAAVNPATADPKLMCYNCGVLGHRANQCPNPRNPAAVAERMKALGRDPCQTCGKYGHPTDKCWNLEANAHLRPPGWRGPQYAPGYPKNAGVQPQVTQDVVQAPAIDCDTAHSEFQLASIGHPAFGGLESLSEAELNVESGNGSRS